MKNHYTIGLLCLLGLAACSPRFYQPAPQVAYTRYDVSPSQADSSVQQLLAPYASSLQQTMGQVIGDLAVPLEKRMPENSLGFFMTDAYLAAAEKVFGTRVDLALMNTGGIRLNNLPAGPIRVGTIYELMPFDNLLVLLRLNGNQLQALMDHIAGRGGWPLSGGTYRVEGRKARDIQINGKPIDAGSEYVIALSDYVANGGDDCSMLANLPQQNKGYLQRDALIQYVKDITSSSRRIELPMMNRVQINQ